MKFFFFKYVYRRDTYFFFYFNKTDFFSIATKLFPSRTDGIKI